MKCILCDGFIPRAIGPARHVRGCPVCAPCIERERESHTAECEYSASVGRGAISFAAWMDSEVAAKEAEDAIVESAG